MTRMGAFVEDLSCKSGISSHEDMRVTVKLVVVPNADSICSTSPFKM